MNIGLKLRNFFVATTKFLDVLKNIFGIIFCYRFVFLCINITVTFYQYFSEEQAKLAARKYARIIQKLGFEVSYFLY